MSIEDRDWYREEYARREGRKPSHEWGGGRVRDQPRSVTIGEFLKKSRHRDTAAKDIYYNPKEFRGSKPRYKEVNDHAHKHPAHSANTRKQGNSSTEQLAIVPLVLTSMTTFFVTAAVILSIFAVKPEWVIPTLEFMTKVIETIVPNTLIELME